MSAPSSSNVAEHSKRVVAYYYDDNIGNYYYGAKHFMKPHRIRLAHHLVLGYGLYRHLNVYRPHPATEEDLARFHSKDYIRFLKSVTPDNVEQMSEALEPYEFNIDNSGEENDCPAFEGLFEFCQASCGGSIGAGEKLNNKKADIAINWMGGLHHAKKFQASGFCYANDIVLGILELLKHHQRVLYVDIDVHHGDGVEEAFYTTDRVMTVSFHKHADGFFPETGDVDEVGEGKGSFYSVNVPLLDGITDDNYASIFVPVMTKVLETFRPEAVVLQCGADSLCGDKLARSFNLTLNGHGACVEFFRKTGLPLMLLGGGGYTPRNVARCWANETAIALGVQLPNDIPYNDYFHSFAPDYTLHLKPWALDDFNSKARLRRIYETIVENLRQQAAAPSVQMQPIPEDGMSTDDSLDMDSANPDERLPAAIKERLTVDLSEFFDGESDGDDVRNEHSHQPQQKRPTDVTNHSGSGGRKKPKLG